MMEAPVISRVGYQQWGDLQSKVVSFLDENLRQKSGFSVRQEYPSLFGEYPGGESMVIEQNGQVVSHLALVVRQFQHADFRIRVGLIGSVTTDKAFQGQGFASQLLRQAVSELKRRGCVIAVLWSDRTEFYGNLGFVRAGREVDMRFSASALPETEVKAVPYEEASHAHYVWRLYQKHSGRLDRSLEEQKRLGRIPKTKMFVTVHEGQATSYLAIQKGADFEDYIHEWGGDLNLVQKNIHYVQKHFYPDRSLTLIAPSYYDLEPLKRIAVERWDGVLGLVKVLDKLSLAETYSSFLAKHKHTCRWLSEPERIQIDGFDHLIPNESELAKVVFGEATSPVRPALPFFLWGFDSI